MVLHRVDGIRRRDSVFLSVLLAFAGRVPLLCSLGITLLSLRAHWRFLPLNCFDFARSAKTGCRSQLFQREKKGESLYGRLCCPFPLRKMHETYK